MLVPNFVYYRISFRLLTPMLGTATETSIHHEHVIEKAKKEIAKANRLSGKISKALDKFKGSDISEKKEVKELQAVLRTYLQLLGRPLDVPESVGPILEIAAELEQEFQEQLKSHDQVKATVFLRDENGMPILGSHMILGNLKENLKIMVNNGDKSILKYKLSVGETLALDVKPVVDFMSVDHDILRAESQEQVDKMPVPGKGRYILDQKGRVLLERPIRFERMGKQETAIAISEQLPKDTEFSCVVRVRNESPINEDALNKLLDFGKSNGFGAWRGSGNMGAYCYKMEMLEEFDEDLPEGWS